MLNDGKVPTNLKFHHLPILVSENRTFKTYFEQVLESSYQQMNNTNNNVLYIPSLDMIITSKDIEIVYNAVLEIKTNRIVQFPDENNTCIYKHFEIDNEEIPPELDQYKQNIIRIEKEISILQNKVLEEKEKIINNKFVSERLNNPIPGSEIHKMVVKKLISGGLF